jgi:hypothetical protein
MRINTLRSVESRGVFHGFELFGVYEHFQAFELAQIHIQAFENGACVAVLGAANVHRKRLLILQNVGERAHGLFALKYQTEWCS